MKDLNEITGIVVNAAIKIRLHGRTRLSDRTGNRNFY